MRTPLLAVLALTAVACRSHRRDIVGHLTGGQDATRVATYALDLGPGERIELVTPHGTIEARAVPGATPSLTATLRSSGRTLEEATMVLEGYELAFDHVRGALRVSLRGNPTRVADREARLTLGASVDYVLTVGEGVALEVDTQGGDITAAGPFAHCQLDTRYGDIAVSGVQGDLSARSSSGGVTARDIAGTRVRIESGYGSLNLDSIKATDLHAETKSGDLMLVNATAERIDLDTNFGTVTVSGAQGSLRASSRSGNISLLDVHGEIAAESQYGRLEVDGVLTGLRARSSSGTVRARAQAGSSNASDWRLSSGYGEVTLEVPADFACRLEAATRFGQVECGLPMTVDAGRRKDGSVQGTINGGGRTVTLRSDSGDVTLRPL